METLNMKLPEPSLFPVPAGLPGNSPARKPLRYRAFDDDSFQNAAKGRASIVSWNSDNQQFFLEYAVSNGSYILNIALLDHKAPLAR